MTDDKPKYWATFKSEWGDVRCIVTDATRERYSALIVPDWMDEEFLSKSGQGRQSIVMVNAQPEYFVLGESVVLTDETRQFPISWSDNGRLPVPEVIGYEVEQKLYADGQLIWWGGYSGMVGQ